ncbi:hypothetical protein RJ640_000159 [Escallonia rubra]|uniref:IP5PC-F immunoglobulin-like domain-containing protein n=1 Tax=Escallonia rubra TaxID=112253 RepID=A0AA88UBA0_9ASTE|nr:hypothetical protein RJ640_000159 [Escallonia rubra]
MSGAAADPLNPDILGVGTNGNAIVSGADYAAGEGYTAAAIIKPDEVAEVSVRHEEFHTLEEFVDGIPQSWWSEDTRDKQVALVVIVRGSCSTETRSHRVHVRHCFSAKTVRIDSKGNNSKKYQGSANHRSRARQVGSASDMVDEHRSLHGHSG